MTWPPSILFLCIPRERGGERHFWIPLFLVWPIVVVLSVALSPLFILGVALWGQAGKRRTTIMAAPALFRLYCAARGMRIEATDCDGRFVLALV